MDKVHLGILLWIKLARSKRLAQFTQKSTSEPNHNG